MQLILNLKLVQQLSVTINCHLEKNRKSAWGPLGFYLNVYGCVCFFASYSHSGQQLVGVCKTFLREPWRLYRFWSRLRWILKPKIQKVLKLISFLCRFSATTYCWMKSAHRYSTLRRAFRAWSSWHWILRLFSTVSMMDWSLQLGKRLDFDVFAFIPVCICLTWSPWLGLHVTCTSCSLKKSKKNGSGGEWHHCSAEGRSTCTA